MSEIIRHGVLPIVEKREWVSHYIWKRIVELAVIWILLFSLLIVTLNFAPHLPGDLSNAADAARAATLVDAVILVLLNLLPAT
jgi:hypothetical protein